jgi:hypothetical protein
MYQKINNINITNYLKEAIYDKKFTPLVNPLLREENVVKFRFYLKHLWRKK